MRLNSYFFVLSLAIAPSAFVVSTTLRADAIESVQVPGNGDEVTFKTSFEQGQVFLLKASGAVNLGQDVLDAEYESNGVDTGADFVDGTDVGIDIGLKALRPPKGVLAGRMKWFGAYRPDHTYYLLATGNGQPLTLKLITGGNRAGSGTITVSLFRLSPAAPELSQPLETMMVPVLDQTVQTTMTTTQSVVYLLQASGDGKVGGSGLGRGDAEYDDYRRDGSGYQDTNGRKVDYGLGVDEVDVTKFPRQNWWGPWHQDHIYYLLFAGTGQPIHFHYFDSKYSDNSKTDRLTVKIFPAP